MKDIFNLDPALLYVNHAAVSPWPVRTVEAVKQFAEENGYVGSRHYEQWLGVEQELKQSLATLINAESADEIALLKNTSEGLSLVAQGVTWNPGDNIVISDQEFPSNFIPWDALRHKGVELRIANISQADDPEEAIISQMDEHTRLLSISAVQYASGIRMDLSRLGKACKHFKSLFCVDAIQQIGAIQFDTQAIDADFVIADGHKWMLGPEGLAMFYCKKSSMDQLSLQQFGWHMVEDISDFSAMKNWQPASTARRFECGTQNMLSVHALNASIGILLELGMPVVEKAVQDNVQSLIKLFQALPGITILSPQSIERHAGIFTFTKSGVDNQQLYESLVKQGVVCASRGGGIRFSPHFHNFPAQFEKLADSVENFKGK